MWDYFETVRKRHSVRRYRTDMAVEPEKLHALLEAACAAPSAGDLQAYRITVVTSEEARSRLRAAAHDQAFIEQAPVCLVFSSEKQRSAARFGVRGETLFSLQDATIAASYAQLAAVAAGLASTWVGDFDEKGVRTALELDTSLTPVALLSIGYPAEVPEPSPRRSLDDLVAYV